MIIDKGKQKEDIIQDEEVLLYKLYDISSLSSIKTPFSNTQMIQDKINNLERYWKHYNHLSKQFHSLFQIIIKLSKLIEKRVEYIGTTLHINSCSRNIIQILVVEEYPSKSIHVMT